MKELNICEQLNISGGEDGFYYLGRALHFV